jgi:hypothetical protein
MGQLFSSKASSNLKVIKESAVMAMGGRISTAEDYELKPVNWIDCIDPPSDQYFLKLD